jgi:hypothetical protein
MIGAVLRTSALALVLAPVPASAGTGAPRVPVALTAVPAHLTLAGSARTAVRVTNSGTKRVVVDVSRAGFALDLRGRPRVVGNSGARSAARWLTLRPSHFTLGPRISASLVVAANLPRRAEPGDHDALVLLRTRPLANARVAVRLRMGVVVVVRAPGKVVRRLGLGALRVARRQRQRALDLVVANRGNITETLAHARAVLSRSRNGRPVATSVASSRDLRPRTRGILEFRFTRQLRGSLTARVEIPAERGRGELQRKYRIRVR